MSKGIQFTGEFKQDAVAQVVERGYAVSEVAEELAGHLGRAGAASRFGTAR